MAAKNINTLKVKKYLTDHPSSTAPVVAAYIGVTVNAMRSKLISMIDTGHLVSEKISGVSHYSVKPEMPFGVNPRTNLFNSLVAKARVSSERAGQ